MRTRYHCFLLALVACLALPATGLADPGGYLAPGLEGLVAAPGEIAGNRLASRASTALDLNGGAVELTPELQALIDRAARAAVAPAAAAPQIVYLQAPAAPTTEPASGIAAVLQAVPIETWALLLGVILMIVLQLLGARGASVRSKVDYWIDIAYGLAEAAARGAAPGSVVLKIPAALDAFHRGLTGEGIKPTGADVSRAQAAWTARAEQEHIEADIRAKAAARAAAEAKPVGAGALLAEASK